MRSAQASWALEHCAIFLVSRRRKTSAKPSKKDGSFLHLVGTGDADYVVKAFEKKYPPLKVETVRPAAREPRLVS
jgi:hypothetical protein